MKTRVLHNIGPLRVNDNYTPPQAVADCRDRLTFDGVYQNVWLHRHILKPKTILFVTGDYVGNDNAFDEPMPRELFCNWDQLMELVINHDCELGWHTWSHRNLTALNDRELTIEVSPPFPMRYFAYPYGAFDARVIEAVREAGFTEAFSVHKGDNSEFQRVRSYL